MNAENQTQVTRLLPRQYTPEEMEEYWKKEEEEMNKLPDVIPGRNDPCFCGSGKKFKKCCAAN